MTEEEEDEGKGGLGGAERPPAQWQGTRFTRVPLEEELDLHSFAPRDIPSVVEEYVRACRERGLTLVRLVHGRGRGVQRAEVRRVLARMTAEVEAFADAPPASGGWGATLVTLRPGGATPKPDVR
jgi:DNA-nicking Smr family endonuclease